MNRVSPLLDSIEVEITCLPQTLGKAPGGWRPGPLPSEARLRQPLAVQPRIPAHVWRAAQPRRARTAQSGRPAM